MIIDVLTTEFKDLILIKTNFPKDDRGFFIEQWNKKTFSDSGINLDFVQESHSGSKKFTLRGLHYQDMRSPMGKMLRCISGRVFDVAVDLRKNSTTFGKWYSIELNPEDKVQIYIPVGFAHGFCSLTDWAEVQYLQTGLYDHSSEGTIAWDDPDLNIKWPTDKPTLSERDTRGISLQEYSKNPAFK